jgi:hypothetical protein
VLVGETNGQICTWLKNVVQNQRKIHFRVEEGSYWFEKNKIVQILILEMIKFFKK